MPPCGAIRASWPSTASVTDLSRLFATRFRVRSYELDMLGHVNNAVFLNWLEQARLEIFEEIGWSLEALIDGRWLTNVVRIEIDYRREVRFGDEVELTTRVERLGRSSITLAHQMLRRSEVVADARVVVVWLGADGRPSPVPDDVRAALGRGDAG